MTVFVHTHMYDQGCKLWKCLMCATAQDVVVEKYFYTVCRSCTLVCPLCTCVGSSSTVWGWASAGDAPADAICRPAAVAATHLRGWDQVLWGETNLSRETTHQCQRHGKQNTVCCCLGLMPLLCHSVVVVVWTEESIDGIVCCKVDCYVLVIAITVESPYYLILIISDFCSFWAWQPFCSLSS